MEVLASVSLSKLIKAKSTLEHVRIRVGTKYGDIKDATWHLSAANIPADDDVFSIMLIEARIKANPTLEQVFSIGTKSEVIKATT